MTQITIRSQNSRRKKPRKRKAAVKKLQEQFGGIWSIITPTMMTLAMGPQTTATTETGMIHSKGQATTMLTKTTGSTTTQIHTDSKFKFYSE